MPKQRVGMSESRTPGKHDLLNKIVGRESGSLPYIRWIHSPYTLIDLCAGDGAPSVSGTSSPEILHKHYSKMRDSGHGARLLLCEKNMNAFDSLKQQPWLRSDVVLCNIDSQKLHEKLHPVTPVTSHVFIHNDPNKVTDWCITPELLALMPKYFTTLSTLGCNVNGLKRMNKEDREEWKEKVFHLVERLPVHHSAWIAVLNKDAHQWAYLVTGPKTWETKYCQDIRKAFAGWEKGVDISSLDDDLWSAIDRLVYSKQEVLSGL